jgi:hypothetical protein
MDVKATDDRQLQGDMPEQVSTVVGYSSAEMTVTLRGVRRFPELAAHQLFSPYLVGSPLYGVKVIGTPVRYARLVVLPGGGDMAVRQFTGWIRSYELDRDTDEVRLWLSDVVDVQNKQASLPLWAVFGTDQRWSPSRLIKLTWVVDELLMQASRSPGPVPSRNALAFFKCTGSLLPSFGYGHLADGSTERFYKHGIAQENADAFIPGKYGITPAYVTAGPLRVDTANYAVVNANSLVVVPRAIDSWSTTIGFSGWFYSDGTGGHTSTSQIARATLFLNSIGNASGWLDDAEYPPIAALTVWRDGWFRVSVREDGSRTSPGAWTWTRQATLPAGWHYIDARITFTNTGVTIGEVRVDDALVSMTAAGGTPARAYAYFDAGGSYFVNGRDQNAVLLVANIPCQHIEISGGATSQMAPYTPSKKAPPTTADGRPRAVIHNEAIAELNHIPNTYKRNAWDVLREVAAADFAVLHTDEYGTLHYVPHNELRNDINAQTFDPVVISDDRLLGFVVNPTYDGYRNSITMTWTDREAIREHVWKNDEPDATMAREGVLRQIQMPLNEAISVVTTTVLTQLPAAQAPANGADVINGGVAAVYLDEWGVPADTASWGVGCYHRSHQRSFQLDLNAQAALPDPHTGLRFSFQGGTQGAIFIPGMKYSSQRQGTTTVSNAAEITTNGLQSLEIDASPWRQGDSTLQVIAGQILADTLTPAPVIDGISIPADPRIQLRDIVQLVSEDGITGALLAQVIGIRREDAEGGSSVDTLTMRVVRTPGIALWDDPLIGWGVGTWGD